MNNTALCYVQLCEQASASLENLEESNWTKWNWIRYDMSITEQLTVNYSDMND